MHRHSQKKCQYLAAHLEFFLQLLINVIVVDEMAQQEKVLAIKPVSLILSPMSPMLEGEN